MGDMTKKQAEIAVKCLTCKYILETCPVDEAMAQAQKSLDEAKAPARRAFDEAIDKIEKEKKHG